MWPTLRPNDCVRVIALDRRGYVNAIEPDAKGDRWRFEILFEEPPDPRVILRAETDPLPGVRLPGEPAE